VSVVSVALLCVCVCMYVCVYVCMYVTLHYPAGLGNSALAPCAPREPKYSWSLFSTVVGCPQSKTILLTSDKCGEIMEQASIAKHKNKKTVVSYRNESISY